ncbi:MULTISPECIES: iron dicitrate transport regulator FecR [unclassified Methylophaga]|uniref:iron dicitrate transport regulator FecR n=1 Tax=unclassified Methylophaga TaxID=2629249 RepID=UPI0025ED3542|nr:MULTISPECIES: iron dicitrate transport regulator FecR [unclassified Methylophaga]
MMLSKKIALTLFSCSLLFSSALHAQSVGVVKTLVGNVQLIRAGEPVKVVLGDEIHIADKLQTDSDSSVGILFSDDTRLGAGPNTLFSIDVYQFDNVTQRGLADLSVENGTLALVGGKLTAKNLDAIKVHTPTTMLAASCSTLSVKVNQLIKEAP